MAEAYLAQQPHELFSGRNVGAVYALRDRLEGWGNTALVIIEKLPEGNARPRGLSGRFVGGRRSSVKREGAVKLKDGRVGDAGFELSSRSNEPNTEITWTLEETQWRAGPKLA
jgi:hypothetical protein